MIAAAVAMAISAAITAYLVRPGARVRIMDHPNERSLHEVPVPRTGGLAIVGALAMVGGAALVRGNVGQPLLWLVAAVAAVAVTSFLDDRFALSVRSRLLVHLLAAATLVATGLRIDAVRLPGMEWSLPTAVASALSFFFIVWMINLYNFMDGMDGFAGSMAVVGFGILGLIAWRAGDAPQAAVNWAVAGSAAGFLLFNFPPARIFMGDTGSSALGLLAAAMCLWASRTGVASLWVSVLVFSPFIVDATVTLARRSLRGEKVWLPHRTHFYQRLVQAGWTHRQTLIGEIALMLLCGVGATIAVGAPVSTQWAILGAFAGLYAVLCLGIAAYLKNRDVEAT